MGGLKKRTVLLIQVAEDGKVRQLKRKRGKSSTRTMMTMKTTAPPRKVAKQLLLRKGRPPKRPKRRPLRRPKLNRTPPLNTKDIIIRPKKSRAVTAAAAAAKKATTSIITTTTPPQPPPPPPPLSAALTKWRRLRPL